MTETWCQNFGKYFADFITNCKSEKIVILLRIVENFIMTEEWESCRNNNVYFHSDY